MKLWVDPNTGKKYMDKLEDFDYDKHKDFETIDLTTEVKEKIELKFGKKKTKKTTQYLDENFEKMVAMKKAGLNCKQIAEKLGVSSSPIQKRIKNI